MVAPGESDSPRFGFIVSRAIGSSVARNRVKRRLRAAARELLTDAPVVDIVFRADPTSNSASVEQWVSAWSDVLRQRQGAV